MNNEHILKNLSVLIRNASLKYSKEFVWQDVTLTEDFKEAYGAYLNQRGFSIEFFGSTAVITTSNSKFIFVPNQWFVIASYAVDVFKELDLYKACVKDISDMLEMKIELYAKQLRDTPFSCDKDEFLSAALEVIDVRFPYACATAKQEAAHRLWRFATDYSWWSGQKTIDRGDFYLSVILNMLNLLNASQSFVAEIVCAYANSFELEQMVKQLDDFTVNLTKNDKAATVLSTDICEEVCLVDANRAALEATNHKSVLSENGRHKIKLSTTNAREIRYR